MNVGHITIGLFASFVGSMMLFGVFSSPRHGPLALRVAGGAFGVFGLTLGVLHAAQGFGLKWATAELRGNVFMWFLLPCALAWIWAWSVDRKRE